MRVRNVTIKILHCVKFVGAHAGNATIQKHVEILLDRTRVTVRVDAECQFTHVASQSVVLPKACARERRAYGLGSADHAPCRSRHASCLNGRPVTIPISGPFHLFQRIARVKVRSQRAILSDHTWTYWRCGNCLCMSGIGPQCQWSDSRWEVFSWTESFSRT
jgi:hypothetical protein